MNSIDSTANIVVQSDTFRIVVISYGIYVLLPFIIIGLFLIGAWITGILNRRFRK